jgi:hypothetical protein
LEAYCPRGGVTVRQWFLPSAEFSTSAIGTELGRAQVVLYRSLRLPNLDVPDFTDGGSDGFWDGGSPPLTFCLDLFLGRATGYDGRDRIWSRAGGGQAGFRGGSPSAFVRSGRASRRPLHMGHV